MQKKYWKKYYKSHNIPLEPSLFAKFVLNNHIQRNSSLFEMGCGNGRDAIFFAMNDINVLAIDQCEEEISFLSEINKHANLKFKSDDFTCLGDIGIFDNIYSRFALHSVSEAGENKTIDWTYKHLNVGGKILIEARGQKNELYKIGQPVEGEPDAFFYNNHYRRFINLDELSEKLKKKGFEIASAEEKFGFAPFKGIDQVFMRIIAIKK